MGIRVVTGGHPNGHACAYQTSLSRISTSIVNVYNPSSVELISSSTSFITWPYIITHDMHNSIPMKPYIKGKHWMITTIVEVIVLVISYK